MAESVIVVENLSKRFDDVLSVARVSFTVAKGATVGLLGANGAGKTTTLSMLLGVVEPSGGRIEIFGLDMARRRHDALARMNFSSPYIDLPQRLSVEQNLDVYARLYNVPERRARIEEVLHLLDLSALRRRPVGTLSAGQRTRAALAKALINQPDLLLLDEPTASLDPSTGQRVRQMLKDYQRATGATLLLASHNMPEVERLCDTVLMMKQGRIIDHATPAELIAKYGRQSLEEVFLTVAGEEVEA